MHPLLLLMFFLPAVQSPQADEEPLPRVGVGVKASTLGIGFEGATALTRRSNVRFGFNLFNQGVTFQKHGLQYLAAVNLRSVQVTYDQYLSGGFHVSPGILLYNGNRVKADTSAAPGQSLSFGGVRYFSSSVNPLRGDALVEFRKAAPMVLAGFGNLLPRSARHIGVNVDLGVVFQGPPKTQLSISGDACALSPSTGCVNAGADPIVQSNVRAEQDRLNEDLKPFRFLPVVSVGVSWKF